MLSSKPFENFHEYMARITAFYIETCHSSYRLEIKVLSHEMLLFQLSALAEAYQKDITRLILQNNTQYLSRYHKNLKRMLGTKAPTSNWNNLYTEIIDFGVTAWAGGTYLEWIDNIVKDALIGKPAISRLEWLRLDEIIATRNLLAHSRGVVDDNYLKRTAKYYQTAGEMPPTLNVRRVIDNLYCHNALECTQKVIKSIDDEVCKIISK